MHLSVGVLAPAAEHRHETALQRAVIAGISLETAHPFGPASGIGESVVCRVSGIGWSIPHSQNLIAACHPMARISRAPRSEFAIRMAPDEGCL